MQYVADRTKLRLLRRLIGEVMPASKNGLGAPANYQRVRRDKSRSYAQTVAGSDLLKP
jgi:hypothetical protein